MTTQQYFSTCWQGSVVWDLYDSIVQAKQDNAKEAGNNRVPGTYAPHWSITAVEQGMNAGDVVQVTCSALMITCAIDTRKTHTVNACTMLL